MKQHLQAIALTILTLSLLFGSLILLIKFPIIATTIFVIALSLCCTSMIISFIYLMYIEFLDIVRS